MQPPCCVAEGCYRRSVVVSESIKLLSESEQRRKAIQETLDNWIGESPESFREELEELAKHLGL